MMMIIIIVIIFNLTNIDILNELLESIFVVKDYIKIVTVETVFLQSNDSIFFLGYS